MQTKLTINNMISPIETKAISLVQATCIQKFDFGFDAPECGKSAAFLIKSIYTPEYSIMCEECKDDFFNNIAFQTVVKDYRSYHYTPELNMRFAEELQQYLDNQDLPEQEATS